MPITLIAPMFFTVALLVATGYFLVGSIPLLILKHDTPLDSRFVRGFFNTYYLTARFTAIGAAVSYAFAGMLLFAAGAAALALLAIFLRGKVIPKMDVLRAQIHIDRPDAISGFRRMHLFALLINMVQLVLIVWVLISVSMSMR